MTIPTIRTTVRSYLESVSREEIEALYAAFHAPPYGDRVDELVAEHLTVRARARGYDLEIKGSTMGRYRSTIGLVRSPRVENLAPSEPQLPLQGPAAGLPEWASIAKSLSSIESALWAMHGLLKRSPLLPTVDRALDEIEQGRPS